MPSAKDYKKLYPELWEAVESQILDDAETLWRHGENISKKAGESLAHNAAFFACSWYHDQLVKMKLD